MFQGFLAEVLTSATISLIAVAALGFMTRTWISERLKNAIKHEYDLKIEGHRAQLRHEYDYKVEGFKAQLKSQGEVELERLRSQLAMQVSEREIVFARLHEKRADVIAHSYGLLRSLHTALGEYTKIFEPAGGTSKDERRAAAAAAHRSFIEYYPAHRIFLPRSSVRKIDDLNSTAKEIYHSFLYEIDLVGGRQGDTQRWIKLFQRVKEDMERALEELEDEFRHILGDDESGSRKNEKATTVPIST